MGIRDSYKEAALRGTKAVTMSIIASTITTIVVYLPLATVDDLAGQMFGQLGFTIVFAMLASLISAMTLVPLFYSLFKLTEKKEIPANRIVDKTTRVYRKILRKVLHRKLVVVGVTLALVAVAGLMLTQVNMELMPASDEGIVEVSASFRPGTCLLYTSSGSPRRRKRSGSAGPLPYPGTPARSGCHTVPGHPSDFPRKNQWYRRWLTGRSPQNQCCCQWRKYCFPGRKPGFSWKQSGKHRLTGCCPDGLPR